MWTSEFALNIIYRASSGNQYPEPDSPSNRKMIQSLEDMNTDDVGKILATGSPIMLTPSMQERVKESVDEKNLFELLKKNTAIKLLNIKQYFEKINFLKVDDYYVTYIALMDMRPDIHIMLEKLPTEKNDYIQERLRQHDAKYSIIDYNHHIKFLSTLRKYISGDFHHEQILTLMNLTYDSASASLFDIYKTVYDEMALQKR